MRTEIKPFSDKGNALLISLTVISAIFGFFIPYINHIVVCFQSEKYILLIAGILAFPIGWVHGFGQFFGWWG